MKQKNKKLPPVTAEEMPYALPEGWKWVRWGECGQFISGNVFKKDFQGNPQLSIPFYKVGSLKYTDGKGYLYDTSNTIDEITRKKIKAHLIPINSIIFAKIGEAIRLNRRSLNKVPCCIDNNLMAFITSEKCEFLFVYYWTRHIKLYDYTNATTVPAIRKTDLEKVLFPLAPIEEQKRLIKVIASLSFKLDEAEKKIDQALAAFPARRAALLHRAFTGDLTAKWRKEHGVGMEGWSNKSLVSMCHSLKYGTAKKSKKQGKVAVLRMGNLQNGEIDWENLVYTEDADDIAKYQLLPGDVLFNRTNSPELVGKTSIYRGERSAIYAGYLIKLDYDRKVLIGDYLNYVLNSPDAKAYCMHVKSDGVSQSNINAKKIGAYEIPVPTLPEQQEIVRLLDGLLGKEDKAKTLAVSMKEKIARLRAAILARAFRGNYDPLTYPTIQKRLRP